MYVIPVNSNTVGITAISTGCCKSEFDSTYPIRLNGIIRQDEFQQSITMINQVMSSRTSRIVLGLIAGTLIIGGIVLFIVSAFNNSSSHSGGTLGLVIAGVFVLFLGIMVSIFGQVIVRSRRTQRVRQAIARESAKYSVRSPIPCSWRLHAVSMWFRGYRSRRSTVIYRIIIEIGHPPTSEGVGIPYQFNQGPLPVIPYYTPPNNIPPPPLYHNALAGRFCSHCGMQHQNSTAKFCSSCGQTLNF